jgi:hypothetical protein
MPNDLNVIRQPACMHLRSKGMYVTGLVDPADDVEPHSDGYCWCNQTQHVLGPDDQLVDRANCNSGRTCYQAIL